MTEPAATVTITLMGRDRPGVTAAMTRTLSAFRVEVLDMEQIVLRGRLVLGFLVTAPRDATKLRAAVEHTAACLAWTSRSRQAPATTSDAEVAAPTSLFSGGPCAPTRSRP